jgi:hypothetical protein
VRIFVVSDTHGRINEFIKKVEYLEKPDMIIHLGDYIEDGIEIEKRLNINTIKIRGNCDFYTEKKNEETILNIGDKRIFLTHGHKYNVKMGILNLYYAGKEENADLILYGHTHIPSIEKKDGMIFLNPGSPSMPRGRHKRTFAIVEIGDKIKADIIEI